MVSALVLVQPTGEIWQKIRVELNEDVKTRENDLTAIKTWLKQEPHLPDEWDERGLLSFLRGCSFSLEKTKKKLDMFFTMRTACPEFFANRDVNIPELLELTKRAQAPVLPGLTPEGRRVIICRGLDRNLEADQLTNGLKLVMMMGDIRLLEEVEGVAGDVYILDASIVKPSHLGGLSLSLLKKFFICVQEAYPVKLKEVHILNLSPLIDSIFTMVKPFLKEKLRKRIHFHKTLEDLHKLVPREMLPVEYGGTCGTMDELWEAWFLKVQEYTGWLNAQESIKTNEALRPGKPTNYDELFGIDGSFRQLSID